MHPVPELTDPLVWIDLEMTGLDPETDVIVELAVIVTDGDLETIIEGPDLVIAAPPTALDAMVPIVREMHEASGLLEDIGRSSVTVEEAERAALAFVTEHVPAAGAAPLAGNSVHSDRAFLRRYMPALDSHLHYRHVDVSTVKELARRWYPAEFARRPDKEGGHRAMADIRDSIDELRYFRRQIFAGAHELQ